MNLVLFHSTKNESGSVSSHQKKVWSCLISSKKIWSCLVPPKKNLVLSHPTEKKSRPVLVLTRDRTGQGQEILVLVVSITSCIQFSLPLSPTWIMLRLLNVDC